MMNTIDNPDLQLALDFVQDTNDNVFLTGKAGTGKTTFLHNLKKISPKRMIVVAPTGVAAINAGGVTIHSFFQLPFGPQIPDEGVTTEGPPDISPRMEASKYQKFSREKISIIKSLDLLVIDEISMVRADLLDAVDAVLRRYRDRQKPFGGIQLLMIGDIQQLAPVIRDEDWEILRHYYDTVFFFSSRALQKTQFVSIELKHIYRQSDRVFIDLLNRIRDNKTDQETLRTLNKRYNPQFNPSDEEGYIILTTHNNKAQEINNTKLRNIKARAHTYKATIEGEFPEYAYPTEPELILKTGAQVMFVKNDLAREKRFFNGKIGTVTGFDESKIHVQCPGDQVPIEVEPAAWQNMKYSLDGETKEIRETEIGSFSQYPLKLAWAITIHKSQGLTFDRAIIDARAAFAHGQVYVALSRCRTLEGLVLSTPVSGHGIINDTAVAQFTHDVENNAPGIGELNRSKKAYRQMLLHELFDFSPLQRQILYCLKLLKEHQPSVFGTLPDALAGVNESLKSEMIMVASKFSLQLDSLIQQQQEIEANDYLQERIKKACRYFTDKMQVVLTGPLEDAGFETDNKEIKKVISQAVSRLEQDAAVKTACLEACLNGFSIRDYLEARAKAAIEAPGARQGRKKTDTVANEKNIAYPELYSRFAAWRARKAAELDLPHYMILPHKTLVNLVNSLPCSLPALKAVKGMGGKKTARFGEEITGIVLAFCSENNLVSPMPDKLPEIKIKAEKKDTRQVSLALWQAGKPVEEIAAIRNMAVSTIEGHLAHFVGTGVIGIERLISPEKAVMIAEYFSRSETFALSPAKEALGNDVTYSELRYVLKHMEANGTVNMKS